MPARLLLAGDGARPRLPFGVLQGEPPCLWDHRLAELGGQQQAGALQARGWHHLQQRQPRRLPGLSAQPAFVVEGSTGSKEARLDWRWHRRGTGRAQSDRAVCLRRRSGRQPAQRIAAATRCAMSQIAANRARLSTGRSRRRHGCDKTARSARCKGRAVRHPLHLCEFSHATVQPGCAGCWEGCEITASPLPSACECPPVRRPITMWLMTNPDGGAVVFRRAATSRPAPPPAAPCCAPDPSELHLLRRYPELE